MQCQTALIRQDPATHRIGSCRPNDPQVTLLFATQMFVFTSPPASLPSGLLLHLHALMAMLLLQQLQQLLPVIGLLLQPPLPVPVSRQGQVFEVQQPARLAAWLALLCLTEPLGVHPGGGLLVAT